MNDLPCNSKYLLRSMNLVPTEFILSQIFPAKLHQAEASIGLADLIKLDYVLETVSDKLLNNTRRFLTVFV